MSDNVWIDLHQAARLAGRHYKTALKAAQEYDRTGRTGLAAYQPSGPRGRWFTTAVDVDRWVRREAPVKPTRRLRAA